MNLKRKHLIDALNNGMELKEACTLFNVKRRTAHDWKTIWEREKRLERKKPCGRPRILSEEWVDVLLKAAPGTQVTLRKDVHEMIAPRTVSDYLQRKKSSRKERELPEKVLRVEEKHRVYVDKRRFFDTRLKKGKRYKVYCAVRENKLLHEPILMSSSIKEHEFMNYIKNALVPTLHPDDVIFWNNFGYKNGTHHCNSTAIQMIGQCEFLTYQEMDSSPVSLPLKQISKAVTSSLKAEPLSENEMRFIVEQAVQK